MPGLESARGRPSSSNTNSTLVRDSGSVKRHVAGQRGLGMTPKRKGRRSKRY
jgi:hypothetical protein